jgi:hypothetical protein
MTTPQALRFLRKSLGPDIIQGRGDEPIGIRVGAIDCDAVTLQRAHAAGELEQAADVYNTLGSWEAGVLPSWEAFPKAQAAALKAI